MLSAVISTMGFGSEHVRKFRLDLVNWSAAMAIEKELANIKPPLGSGTDWAELPTPSLRIIEYSSALGTLGSIEKTGSA